jgi:hypothetical protein
MAQAVRGRARRCARGPENAKDRCKYGQNTNLGALRSQIRFDTNSRRIKYEQVNSATDY